MPQISHEDRVKQELIAAKMTKHGLRKSESHQLPEIIHKNEHIGGVVYGHNEQGSCMLVATDKRVIYLHTMPLFKANEELTYDVVSGFALNTQGVVNSIVLHTKVKDISLRYVNRQCALHFKDYLESRRLERQTILQNDLNEVSREPDAPAFPFFTAEASTFLQTNDIAVLSTVNRAGHAEGAVVYYLVDNYHRVYIVAKAEAVKAKNIPANKRLSLTVFDAKRAQVLQLQGDAAIETNEEIKAYVLQHIIKLRQYSSGYQVPPTSWLKTGKFMVIRITPTRSDLSNFGPKNI